MTKLIDTYADSSSHARQARLARFAGNLLGYRVFFYLSRILYRLNIIGEENIPSKGAAIFAMNHVSLLADALVYLTIRRHNPDVHIFAWQHLKGESPMFDFLLEFGEPDLEERFLQVYKARGISAGGLLRAFRAIEAGKSIVITAEGDLTWDGRFQHPLEPGTAWMALRTAAPVVPIVSIGGYDVQPYWWIDKMRLTGRITIRIGKPLQVSKTPMTQYDNSRLETTSQLVWDAMNDLILQGH